MIWHPDWPPPTTRIAPSGSCSGRRYSLVVSCSTAAASTPGTTGRGCWNAPVVTTTLRASITSSPSSSRKPPFPSVSAVTAARSRTGAPNELAYPSRQSTTSTSAANASGSSPEYSQPGSRWAELGVFRKKPSQRCERHVSATRPRSRTTCSRSCWVRKKLVARPAWPAPITAVSTRSIRRLVRPSPASPACRAGT